MAEDKRISTMLKAVRIILNIILSVIFYLLVIFAISKLCTEAFDFSYQIFGNVPAAEAPGTDTEFVVNEGESTMSIAAKLEYNKLIVNKYSFFIRAKLSTGKNKIIPGTYELNTSMTYSEILTKLTGSDNADIEEAT